MRNTHNARYAWFKEFVDKMIKKFIVVILCVAVLASVSLTFFYKSEINKKIKQYYDLIKENKIVETELMNRIKILDEQLVIYEEQFKIKQQEKKETDVEIAKAKKEIKSKESILKSTREELFSQITVRDTLISSLEKGISERDDIISLNINAISNLKIEVASYKTLYENESKAHLMAKSIMEQQIRLNKRLKKENKILKAAAIALTVYAGVKSIGG